MKVVRLYVENVKRIKVAEVRPRDAVVIVGGKNDAGKSSLLDAIEMAMAGKRSIAKQPLRKGAAAGRVILDLGDIIVTRSFAASGATQLKVESKAGKTFSSPQSVLDRLYGALTFDPLEFERQEPEDQAEILRKLVGLDFSKLDARRQELYDERTQVGREAKALQVGVDASSVYEGVPAEEISIAGLAAELAEAERLQREAAKAEQAALAAAHEGAALVEHIDSLDERIRELENELAGLREARQVAWAQSEQHANFEQAAQNAEAEAIARVPDTEAIRARLREAESINDQVRNNRQHAEKAAMLADAKRRSEDLTQQIERLDAEKAEALAEAKYPVPGLSINEAGSVMLGDYPFEQASTSDRVRISVAMGLALNPELRILLVRDGSLLGAEKLRLIESMVREADAQLWLEMMSEEPNARTTVFIEEGRISDKQPRRPQVVGFEKP